VAAAPAAAAEGDPIFISLAQQEVAQRNRSTEAKSPFALRYIQTGEKLTFPIFAFFILHQRKIFRGETKMLFKGGRISKKKKEP
jgi:hypothetical protein